VAKKNLSSDDSDLFRQTVGKVHRVHSDKAVLTHAHKPKPYPKPTVINPADDTLLAKTRALAVETVSSEDSMSFLNTGLQYAVLKKLRRGQFGLDAELDLHGLSSLEAKRQLLHFLHDCIEEGCRCVHIVHGKGHRSPDNHPILKNNLNLWLRQHPAVQAFCSAAPKDGGAGALWVLLQLSEKYRTELGVNFDE
jgi:DNA-nicking Smr family endonuclease